MRSRAIASALAPWNADIPFLSIKTATRPAVRRVQMSVCVCGSAAMHLPSVIGKLVLARRTVTDGSRFDTWWNKGTCMEGGFWMIT